LRKVGHGSNQGEGRGRGRKLPLPPPPQLVINRETLPPQLVINSETVDLVATSRGYENDPEDEEDTYVLLDKDKS